MSREVNQIHNFWGAGFLNDAELHVASYLRQYRVSWKIISLYLGYNWDTIRKKMMEHDEQTARMFELWNSGFTFAYIAKQFGLTQTAVRDRLAKAADYGMLSAPKMKLDIDRNQWSSDRTPCTK